MGGTTFDHPATRMSSHTLDLLTAYCTFRLSDICPQIQRMHHVRSKTDHGDLDLICAIKGGAPIKRQHVGLVGRQVDGKAIWSATSGQGDAELKAFAEDVGKRLGAVEWLVAFYGYPLLALKVPCGVLIREEAKNDAAGAIVSPYRTHHPDTVPREEPFYQVDLGLIPPPSFPFYRILTSYSIPYAAIVLALQSLSPAIWLRREALTLRHSPFAGYPLIDITLSADFDAVMHWLGLDLDRWELGFDSKEELYGWLANVREGSVLEQGWEVVRQEGLGRMIVDWKRFHTRVDGLPDYIEWLRSKKTSPIIDKQSGTTTTESLQGQGPSTDPELPTPLDPLAASLLTRFSPTPAEEYSKALASRQSDTRAVATRQRQREENKRKAEEMRVRKAERVAAEQAELAEQAKQAQDEQGQKQGPEVIEELASKHTGQGITLNPERAQGAIHQEPGSAESEQDQVRKQMADGLVIGGEEVEVGDTTLVEEDHSGAPAKHNYAVGKGATLEAA